MIMAGDTDVPPDMVESTGERLIGTGAAVAWVRLAPGAEATQEEIRESEIEAHGLQQEASLATA
jgi:hypothetical protein